MVFSNKHQFGHGIYARCESNDHGSPLPSLTTHCLSRIWLGSSTIKHGRLMIVSAAIAALPGRGPVWGKTGLPPRIDQNQGAGFVGLLYLHKSLGKPSKPKLEAILRSFPCPAYPAVARCINRFCIYITLHLTEGR